MVHSIGKTIAELRKAKGWTQIELAEKLQVSDKAVSKWEQEGGIPSVEFFPALAEVFGVSIDYLMTGKKVDNVNLDDIHSKRLQGPCSKCRICGAVVKEKARRKKLKLFQKRSGLYPPSVILLCADRRCNL